MNTTYILYSKALDKYYIGSTRWELSERLRRHNSQHKGFTSKANDWEVVYAQSFATYQEAHALEVKVKTWKSRKMIEKLIKGQ